MVILKLFKYILLGLKSPIIIINSIIDKKTSDVHIFKYVALNNQNKKEVGIIACDSQDLIENFLLTENKKLIKFKTNRWIKFIYRNINKEAISNDQLMFFLEQLTTLLNHENSMIDSFSIIINKVNNKKFNLILRNVRYQLMCGDNLAISLEKQGESFPPLLISVLKAKEESEKFLLDEIKNYYVDLNKIDDEIRKISFYRLFILPYVLVVIGFIFKYVIPQFYLLYEYLLNVPPSILKILYSISNSFNLLFGICIIISLIIILILFISFKQKKAFHYQNKILILKKMNIYYQLILYSKTLSLLLKYNIVKSNDVGIITSNNHYQKLIIDSIDALSREKVLSPVLKNNPYVPKKVYQMVLTGEKFDSLLLQINNICNFYQKIVNNVRKKVMNILGPLLVIFSVLLVSSVFLIVLFQFLLILK